MRKVRGYLIGAVAGGLLMLGGQALADIPDSQPSVVDSTHTLYACWRDSSAATKSWLLLDKSEGNCPSAYPHQIEFAPVVPQTP